MPDPRKLVTPLLEGLLKPLQKLETGPIKTWHASPHDFDTVDLSKVGTGQGATMYGHGFYSAQSPEVSGPGGAYWKEFAQHPKFSNEDYPQRLALQLLEQNKFDRSAAAAAARAWADKTKAAQYSKLNEDHLRAADILESGGQVGPRVYETHLYARPEDYLDWDLPLHRQSAQVRSALEDVPGQFRWGEFGRGLRGEDIYKGLTDFGGGGRRGQKAATETLSDVGIPGIRYLDQKSRGAWVIPGRLEEISRDIDMMHGMLMDPSHGAEQAAKIKNTLAGLEKEHASLTKQLQGATYNYVTGNTDIIDLARKLAVPGVLATGALPYLNNSPVQTRY